MYSPPPQKRVATVFVEGELDQRVLYANHLFANFVGTDFVLTFAQALPEASGAETDETEPTQLTARTVARIVVPSAHFAEFVKSSVGQLSRLKASSRLAESETEWDAG